MTMIDTDLSQWSRCAEPGDRSLLGQYCRLEPLSFVQHGHGLFQAVCGRHNTHLWDYIPLGPFDDIGALKQALEYVDANMNWKTMVIVSQKDSSVLGMASFMRIRPEHGSAEVGCVMFGPALQRTREATEAIFLMGQHVFDDLGYRRFEWKCNNANAASKRAAERFGFQFEGVFRNDMVMKGKNRDTAWYSIIDQEWPPIRAAFQQWLLPANFDESGRQRTNLTVPKR
jgi:RimJ/RimL family protein N-acetyltransferase